MTIDPAVEHEHVEAIEKWRADARPGARSTPRSRDLRAVAATTENLVPATIALAQAGGTVGEWAGALREVFGEYRAPTGVGAVAVQPGAEMRGGARAGPGDRRGDRAARSGCSSASPASTATPTAPSRSRSRPATPAWRSSTRASGSRPAEIAAAARDEDVDVVGLSILSGSHLALVPETLRLLREAGVDAPVVVGGIIPDADRAELEAMGVARVYTPKDYRLARIMARHRRTGPDPPASESSGRGRQPPMRTPDGGSAARRRRLGRRGRARRRRGRRRDRTRPRSRSWPGSPA